MTSVKGRLKKSNNLKYNLDLKGSSKVSSSTIISHSESINDHPQIEKNIQVFI
jgi:hypothetical protein